MALGFPFEASIRSLLPLVDKFVVAVGKGADDTLARVKAIGDPKIRIIETIWNERMADRGFVYSQQKMIAQCSCTGDWVFYLEGDEAVHEDEIAVIRASVERHQGNPHAALANAHTYHYGWIRRNEDMQKKFDKVGKYWAAAPAKIHYSQFDRRALAPFTGTHPNAAKHWLATVAEPQLRLDACCRPTRKENKYHLMRQIETLTWLDFSHEHFKLVA